MIFFLQQWRRWLNIRKNQFLNRSWTYVPLVLVIQMLDSVIHQAPVVQTLDSAIHRINHYPADKYYGNQLRYPTFEQPGPDESLSSG